MRPTHTVCAPRRAICRAAQAAGGSDGQVGGAAVDAMDRSEEAIAEDADGVRCNACGSVLCVDEPKQAVVPLKRPAASNKRKVSPRMLRYHATRAATRVAMLAAIPGIGTARAVAILRAYPTFRELMRNEREREMSLRHGPVPRQGEFHCARGGRERRTTRVALRRSSLALSTRTSTESHRCAIPWRGPPHPVYGAARGSVAWCICFHSEASMRGWGRDTLQRAAPARDLTGTGRCWTLMRCARSQV